MGEERRWDEWGEKGVGGEGMGEGRREWGEGPVSTE